MKKLFTVIGLFLVLTLTTIAQISGTKNIPGDYATLQHAIADLNTQGVGSGGVIINLITGNPETAPPGGYAITASGSSSDPIIIQGNGNTITASNSLNTGALSDAIFKLIGADYITISGFIMYENPLNTITTAGSNNMTEWGVAILYATTTNGCQNITISENTIDLNRTYQNTFGIYANSTHSSTSVTVSATATTTAGANNNLTITGNSITDVNIGIVVVGPTAAADHNDALTIGGSISGTNTISNYGTTGTISGYANVSGTVNGILVRNTKNFNVSYNSITSSNGGTISGTLRGIYIVGASNSPTGTLIQNINNNTISVRSAVATGAILGIFTESGSGNSTTTLNINNNDFNTITHTLAASGAITLINNTSATLNQNINNNTFSNISCNTTGSFIFISNSVTLPAGGTQNVNGNTIVTGFTKTGAGGTVTLFTSNGSSINGTIVNNNNNNFSNITLTGATTFAGWSNTDGASTTSGPTKTIENNIFSNISTGSASTTVITANFSGNNTSISNNSITNISNAPTTTSLTLTGISIGSSNGGASQTYSNNTISGLTSSSTAGQIIGILGGSTSITTLNISGNSVNGITNSVTTNVITAGIYVQNTGANVNIYKNKIYNISCPSVTVIGIGGAAVNASNTINIYNNLIGRLYATTSTFFQAVRGIYAVSTVAATYNLYYNTVYIDGTCPTQSYCVYIGSSVNNVPNVNSINNIFINIASSTSSALPAIVYFRYGTTTASNLASTTNNNILYCGTPGTSRLLYADGTVSALTNPKQTLSDYLAFVSPRESSSKTENVTFQNTTNGNLTSYLHIDIFVPTNAESGGTVIPGITDDYDGDTRNASTPDIGADEGNFTPLANMSYVSSTTTQNNTNGLALGTVNAEIIGIQIVMSGATNPISLSSLVLNTNGSTNPPSDITNAKVWYTGTSSAFATTTQFGSTFSSPNGSFTVNGTQVLSEGTNYFWVTYDISGSAVAGNFVDAECSNITGNGSMGTQTPTIQAPAGIRQILGPLSGTYTIGLSMMKVLTGKNLEFTSKTRKVKQIIINENHITAKPENKNNSLSGINTLTTGQNADLTNSTYKEVFTEETYSELTESGKVYTGSLFASYNNDGKNTGNNDAIGNYATITAALSDLNSRGVSGAVTFLLIDANYAGETYPLQINENISGVNSSNTITIKPQISVSAVIPGNISSNATIRILSNYVTIDGSNSGGTDRSLTIQNNNITSPNTVLIGSTGTTPITNVTVKNCIITNGANTSSAVVISDKTAIGSAGYFNTITVQNNLIERAYIGVYATGGSSSANGFNLNCSDNTLTTSGSNSIRLVGLYAQYTNGVTVSNNTIGNISNTTETASNIGGIWMATGTTNVSITGNNIGSISSTANTSSYIDFGILISNGVLNSNNNISGNTISGITATNSATATGIFITGTTSGNTIQKNKISNIKNTNTVGWGSNGIYLASTAASGDIIVKNNMIFDIAAYGYASGTAASDNGYGIIITSGTNYKIYNNTVHMNSNQTVNGLPSSLNVTSGVTTANGLDIRNNIFVNTQTTGTNRYAFYSGAANTVYQNINYNCYYTSGPNVGFIGSNRAAIADIRTGTGKDVQSFSRLPSFTSSTDLHILSTNLSVSGRGNFIAGNTDDFDGETRPTTQSTSVKPVDVGCDQYSVSPFANGNICVFSGSTFFDGGLRAVEIVSGVFSTAEVRQYTGVQTPNNTFGKIKNPGNNYKNIKKDGSSGAETDAAAVNTPWIYWELDNISITTGPLVLRFYYNDDQLATIPEASLKISYWNGTAWDNAFPQTLNQTNNYIELTFPEGYGWPSTSLFAIEDASAPLPVTMESFDAAVQNRDAVLNWVTTYELNNKGFAVEKRVKTGESYSVWKEVTFINGNGTSNQRNTYQYRDAKLNTGTYQYRLRQVDFNNNTEYFIPGTNNDLVIGKPGIFEISQNYPNPSNPKSKIDFAMPFDGIVSIKVYDLLGKEVATLINQYKTADFYTVEFDGTNISSGTYFYRITAEGNNQKFTKTLKMILVK